MNRRMIAWGWGLGGALVAASPAWADVIQLASGRRLDGLIVQETDTQVRVQVTWQGYVSLRREEVMVIERSDVAQRETLLEHWRREFQAGRERLEAQRAFESAQRAKGLVLYRGAWISQEELTTIRTQRERLARERQEAQERLRREEEARRLAQRVAALEEERYRLQRMLSSRWAFFTRPAVIIRHDKSCEPKVAH